MSHTQCHSSATRGKCGAALLFLLLWFGKTFGIIHIPREYNISYHVPDLKEPPLITHHSQSYTVFNIEDIFLQCEASGNPKPSFRWVKDGELFMHKMNTSRILTANSSEELKFYQGEYRCYASNELGTAETGLIDLKTENVPVLVKEKKVVKIAKEGDSVVLQCNVPKSSVNTYIHWMDRKLMHFKQSADMTIGLDGNLYFANVQMRDTRDDYTCYPQYIEARTILSTEPVSLKVIPSNEVVKKFPGLHQPEGTHTSYFALRGQTLILECIPYGLPTPSVKWDRKDAPLSSSHAVQDRFDRWLVFDSISESDDGEYTCTASNIIGNVTHLYMVSVEAAPYWTKKPESALYSPGETVRLECHAEGIPTPHITWKINGVPITETGPEPRRSTKGGTLKINDVQVADTAVYQCEASNTHGTALLNTYIHIIELPPQFLTDDSLVYKVIEGSTAALSCNCFGSPRPQIIWVNETLSTVLSNPRMSQMTNGTLHITNVSHEDTGTYVCSVKDSSLSISAHVVVLNKTRITSFFHEHWIKTGKQLVWPCWYEVDARLSKPLIQWRKNGQKITIPSDENRFKVFENGSLMITDIHSKDAGLYTCEVITRLDFDTATGSLIVIDKPDPPHSVKLDEKENRSVTLSWIPGNDNNSPVKEFVIQMREDLHLKEMSWNELKRVPDGIHHLEISLHPYCTYHFKVAAVNTIGMSDYRRLAESYTTPAAVPDMSPRNIRSESTHPDSMIITWEEVEARHFNGPGFGYTVLWRDADNPNAHWESVFVSHPPFIVNQTGAFKPFEVKVQAVNGIGEGPRPDPVLGYSGEDIPLKAPTEITVIQVNGTAVSVKWNPVSQESVRGHLLGYKIYWRRLGSREDHFHRGKEKRALAPVREMVRDMERVMESEEETRVIVVKEKEEAILGDLETYSAYELSVTAFNSKGEGPKSNPTHFNTPEGAPGQVSHFRFESPSETELTLFWQRPHKTNGILKGYIITYQEFVENNPRPLNSEKIEDPTVTQYKLDKLDSRSYYVLSVKAYTSAGEGEAVQINAMTILDGVPPTSVNVTVGETAVNLSWVTDERYRNIRFMVHYMEKNGQWEESEHVNSTQGFYQLQGLKAGTHYHLQIHQNNITYWKQAIQTMPELAMIPSNFVTQGWFIGLISAVVLLLLLLLILCFVKKSKGGKYSVKDKEEGQMDSDAKPMKDEGFGEYRSLESSDNDEKRSLSQRSLCAELKRSSDDSLGEYGDSVDIQFNEDGSFIGQYSGCKDTQPYTHGEHESLGVPSPTNPIPFTPSNGNFPKK